MMSISPKINPITILLIMINVVSFIFTAIFHDAYYWLVQINSLVFKGQVFRLVTAMFAHHDIFHLLSNMAFLFLFGNAVEEYLGKRRYIFMYLLAGFLGNIATLIFLPPNVISLGASGAIFAVVLSYSTYDKDSIGCSIFVLIVFVLLSAGQDVNNLAHLVGGIVGLVFTMHFHGKNQRLILDDIN